MGVRHKSVYFLQPKYKRPKGTEDKVTQYRCKSGLEMTLGMSIPSLQYPLTKRPKGRQERK